MKLVSAKCPSCGADIEVDENSDSTKCDYCNSKIIVDDAIAKYKLEISGEVEVKNMPKLENHLKMGEMHYNDKEYEEAYKEYEKACDLDPENYLAILRKGLTKTLCANYSKLEIKSAINGMKNAYKILEKEKSDSKKINSAINECNSVLVNIVTIVEKYQKSDYASLSREDVEKNINMEIECIEGFEYLYELVKNDNKMKLSIIDNIQNTVNFVFQRKAYSYVSTSGKRIATYTLPAQVRREMNSKRKYYNQEKFNIENPEAAKSNEKAIIKEKNTQQINGNTVIPCYIAVGFFGLIVLGSMGNMIPVTFVFSLVTVLLFIPPLKPIIMEKISISSTVIIILRVIFAILTLFALSIEMSLKYPFTGTWESDNDKIKINSTRVYYYLGDDKIINSDYIIKDDGTGNKIIVFTDDETDNEYRFLYKDEELCILSNNQCSKTYKKVVSD